MLEARKAHALAREIALAKRDPDRTRPESNARRGIFFFFFLTWSEAR